MTLCVMLIAVLCCMLLNAVCSESIYWYVNYINEAYNCFKHAVSHNNSAFILCGYYFSPWPLDETLKLKPKIIEIMKVIILPLGWPLICK